MLAVTTSREAAFQHCLWSTDSGQLLEGLTVLSYLTNDKGPSDLLETSICLEVVESWGRHLNLGNLLQGVHKKIHEQ